MKRKKIVAGNWKMNMTLVESIELSNALININNLSIRSKPQLKMDHLLSFHI